MKIAINDRNIFKWLFFIITIIWIRTMWNVGFPSDINKQPPYIFLTLLFNVTWLVTIVFAIVSTLTDIVNGKVEFEFIIYQSPNKKEEINKNNNK